ncbi:S8 family serine peptidase [Gottfriedia luciferensis]|uniref:S8 family serine peptidase n=1 Tax=Gottfriedia luciferensis TaxID=178774 RepID=UPI000B435179|nr:S8 family serine peptidase [Gottfriedia luciferensis]
MKNKFAKGVAVMTLSTGVLFSSLPNASYSSIAKAQSTSRVEQVLSALTPAQHEAIKQIKLSDKEGLQVSPDLDLTSDVPTSIIVEFKDKPAKTAVMVAETEGTILSETDAQAKVDASHELFDKDLKTIFSKEIKENKNPYKINRSYKKSFNGVSMTLPANKVRSLLKSNVVQRVWSDLQVKLDDPTTKIQGSEQQGSTHNMVTFPGIEELHQEGYTGKGVKVGVIDTGIDYNHPDLKGAYKGGYDFVDNDNDPMETTYADWKKSGMPETNGGEAYYTEHGTHVAGIIAGQGKNTADYAVTGVAPDAEIYAYRVLGHYGSGSTSAILAGIDKAVSDGMDIISMSLGANYNDPLFPTAIAVNNAVLTGATAVVAAGNSGNKMYSLGAPGNAPLAITVGASDTSAKIPNYTATAKSTTGDLPANLKLAAQGLSDDIADFQGKTYQIVNVGTGAENAYYKRDADGKYTIPIDITGKIVLAQRGTLGIEEIVKRAKSHGAKAVVLINTSGDTLQDVFLGNVYGYLPTFLISSSQGMNISIKIPLNEANKGKTLDFTFGDMSQTVTTGNKLADFSSRGPSRVLYDIKPEVTAPGVSVFSTVPSYMHKDDNGNPLSDYKYAYERLSGTSMATPNVSGVAALLKQANPDMTPADIKATLMNTADPLNDKYSVYEAGAGLVNPYKAVHAQSEIQVKDKTKTLSSNAKDTDDSITLASKGIKTIKNITGALSFGEQAVEGTDFTDSRSMTLFNKSSEDKTFDVKVQFQTLDGRFTNDSRADQDAATNGVTLDVSSSVKVERKSSTNMDATINVPKTAKLGTYEGYVVYTNQKNPDETYKIPFAIHTVKEGINYVTGNPAAFTLPYEAGSNATKWSVGVNFKLNSHMRTFDFFLVDPKTNEEIGYLGTADGMGADENTEYYFRGVLNNGQYSPLTGDPDNPVGFGFDEVTPGLWKIRMVGTNDKGETFTKDAPIFYGEKEPKVTMNYEAGQIVETANATDKTVTVSGNAFDKNIAEMQAAGITASQGENKMYYYNPNRSAEINIPVDENGNFNSTIPLATAGPNTLPITEYDFYDRDKSTVENYGSFKDIYFIKKGTAYTTAISDKQRINMGDSTIVTFSTKNIATPVKKAEYSFLYPAKFLDVTNVKPHGAYDGKLDVKYTNTTFNNTYNVMTITATATGDLATTGIAGDTSLVDLTFKAKDQYYKGAMQLEDPTGTSRFFKAVYTNVDNSTVTTQGIQPYFYVTPTYSLMRGAVQAEGLASGFDNLGNAIMNTKIDYNKAGSKISVKDSNGKEYGVSNPLGYSVTAPEGFTTRLPITDKPFTLSINVPGHFTFKKDFTVGIKEDGKVTAGSKPVDYSYIPGGDVDKNNVIDVKDAVSIQQNWKSNNREADINYDGVVDEKDMQYVINNYLMQNPWIDNSPKASKSYKGKTLDDILHEVGMEYLR